MDCSRAHVTEDMFLFGSVYQDVATNLPHYTTGQTYYYPAFNAARSEDALKFAHEFGEVVAMLIMLECITRVRASRWLRMASFHGNFFVRSTDLLAMPTVPQNQSYVIEIDIEDTLTAPFIVLQTGMLHTTCFGERRLRVITTAHPTTSNLSEVFASADQIAIVTLLANEAVERSLSYKLEDARDYVFKKLVDIFITCKSSMTAAGAGASAQLALAENLKMLPVLVLGLLKNAGTVGEKGAIALSLTSERLEHPGLPQLIMDVFDLPNKTTLRVLGNRFSQRINTLIQKMREMRRRVSSRIWGGARSQALVNSFSEGFPLHPPCGGVEALMLDADIAFVARGVPARMGRSAGGYMRSVPGSAGLRGLAGVLAVPFSILAVYVRLGCVVSLLHEVEQVPGRGSPAVCLIPTLVFLSLLPSSHSISTSSPPKDDVDNRIRLIAQQLGLETIMWRFDVSD
ncbi:hypothetical protein B0H17DRAFT_1327154 [Mycena rosella]|uniref:Uncharacterized protein n=1 Tax=Mycena rosella TaxID=1033263 RepID=A0AAD7GQZ9_MYCRO|nr:hypothetical protein B0H17DRAFT_1327154 [Mycena rosella]